MERKPNVLVVDCDPAFVREVAEILGDSFEVISSPSPTMGMEKAVKEAPELVIVGYLEPRGAAFKLHKELRGGRLTKDIPLLVVDVSVEEHTRKGWRRDEGSQMDADDYMSRPIDPTELTKTVNRILRRTTSNKLELTEVLEQVEEIVKRIDRIEEQLVK